MELLLEPGISAMTTAGASNVFSDVQELIIDFVFVQSTLFCNLCAFSLIVSLPTYIHLCVLSI